MFCVNEDLSFLMGEPRWYHGNTSSLNRGFSIFLDEVFFIFFEKSMAFKNVDSRQNYAEMEERVLSFWNEHHIFEKSVLQREGEEIYSFFDGPPFATGLPHYGHIVASVIKDVVPRYWTMRGKYVSRRWGWDCHGLPIENLVEKEIGSTSKKDIEAMGVDVFNEKCRLRVLEFAGEWEKIVPRLGRWVDMDDAYRTMDKDFMESVWWVFKTLCDKGLVYEDYREYSYLSTM